MVRLSKRPHKARLGFPGYIRILARLKHGATIPDLVDEGFAGEHAASRVVLALWKMHRVYISGWVAKHGERTKPIWMAGVDFDVEPPTHRGENQRRRVKVTMPTMPARIPADLVAFGSMLDAMDSGEVSRAQIKEATGLNGHTIRVAVALMLELRLAHRCAFLTSNRGGVTQLFRLGYGRNISRRQARKQRERVRKSKKQAIKKPMAFVVSQIVQNASQFRLAA